MGRTISRVLRLVIILLAVAMIGLTLFRHKYNDAIRSLAETQVMNTTSDLINDAIEAEIYNMTEWSILRRIWTEKSLP